MPEATPAFKQLLRTSLAELQVGQTFTYRRTFTEGDVSTFCGVTGDFNPYHLDEAFAAESWFGRRIVPGLLTGSMLTHIGGLLGVLATEMNFNFLMPVYIGETILCIVTIEEKDERAFLAGVSAFNQEGVEVLKATFRGFPSLIRLVR